MKCKGCERMWQWPHLRSIPEFSRGRWAVCGTVENQNFFNSLSLGWDLNPGPAEYETAVTLIRHRSQQTILDRSSCCILCLLRNELSYKIFFGHCSNCKPFTGWHVTNPDQCDTLTGGAGRSVLSLWKRWHFVARRGVVCVSVYVCVCVCLCMCMCVCVCVHCMPSGMAEAQKQYPFLGEGNRQDFVEWCRGEASQSLLGFV